ncbi:hypothetical protein E2C01_047672 [Portunus trituberculatus]|uniref:Uncharacterized protein n=1 Tax=Portunus trituberculatus TaxID=210409 RepID=A0A5B7G490_PORTR|nr:hypothetical protein [Portunus trituberculatus]
MSRHIEYGGSERHKRSCGVEGRPRVSESLRKASHGIQLSVREAPRVPIFSSSGGQKAVELTSGLLRRCRETWRRIVIAAPLPVKEAFGK